MPQNDISRTYQVQNFRHQNGDITDANSVEFRNGTPSNLAQNAKRVWIDQVTGEIKYTVDGVNIHVIVDALTYGYVNVKTFGAIGDGIANDTTKIADAFAYAGSLPYDATVIFPPGLYKVTAALVWPVGVNIIGYNATLVINQNNTYDVLTLTNGLNQKLSGLTITETNHNYVQRVGGAAVTVTGNSNYVTIEDVNVNGCHDGIAITAADGNLCTNIILNNCHVDSTARYGIPLVNVEEVEITNCKSYRNWLDGIKLRKRTKNVKIYGGASNFNGASIIVSGNGNGLDGFPGAGNLVISGFTTENNNGSGLYIKTGDLNNSGPTNEGNINNINISNCISRFNLGSGADINRVDGDTFPYPLVTHVAIIGGVFEGNQDRGIYIRARNVSITSPMCKNNALEGILVASSAFDVSIVAPIITANGRSDSTQFAGINISGKRVSVIGGTINGADGDYISDDTYTGLTVYHQFAIRVISTADNVWISGVKWLNFNFSHPVRIDSTGYVYVDYGMNTALRNTYGGKGSRQFSANNTYVKTTDSNVTATGWERERPVRLVNRTIGITQTDIIHGLGYIPSNMVIIPRANGVIWESASADITNIHLTASVSTLCDILVW